MKFVVASFTFVGLLCGQAAQAPNPTVQPVNAPGTSAPLYHVTVVARNIKAVNYQHRGRSTLVDFRGTPLMPEAHGWARVNSKDGVTKIDAKLDDLKSPTMFGPEYLTYVLWAITPDGRAMPIGELRLDGDNTKISATTQLQAFGMIVTAEPYYAVTQPSDVVVAENFIRKDTTGKIEEVNAKYELLPRGQYVFNVPPAQLKPVRPDRRLPLDLLEARNAVEIARYAGADRYAGDVFNRAMIDLENAERLEQSKSSKKKIETAAREAAQAAEDARILALKAAADQQLASERQAAAEREAQAKAAAEAEARRRAAAEASQQIAEANQKAEAAERARAEAEKAAAQAEVERAKLEAQKAANQAHDAEAQRAAAQAQVQQANAEAARAQAEAEAARQLRQQAEAERQKAEADRAQLRAELQRQLNIILETRDTARGLIVNMSDVLFDTGKATLRPGAREKLAKISGIILVHPGLKLEIEGHTDSVGGDEYNQRLSEQRANAVRDYLIHEGIKPDSITAKGFGKTRPVATNATPEGRQRNRRVEMVVSGDIIGNASESAQLNR